MDYKDTLSTDAYWNTNTNLPTNFRKAKYIAINGNTAAGKSTLIHAIRELSHAHSMPLMCINEKVLHHPLMKLQFHQAKEYAYLLQLNFMIQRRLLLKRWLELGYHVVIERCHLDDRMFMNYHLQQDNITIAAYEAFSLLDQTLELRLPDPDYYILLDVSAEVAFKRIQKSEKKHERPKEFPDLSTQKQLIEQWSQMYQQYFRQLSNEKLKQLRCKETTFLKWSANDDPLQMTKKIVGFLF